VCAAAALIPTRFYHAVQHFKLLGHPRAAPYPVKHAVRELQIIARRFCIYSNTAGVMTPLHLKGDVSVSTPVPTEEARDAAAQLAFVMTTGQLLADTRRFSHRVSNFNHIDRCACPHTHTLLRLCRQGLTVANSFVCSEEFNYIMRLCIARAERVDPDAAADVSSRVSRFLEGHSHVPSAPVAAPRVTSCVQLYLSTTPVSSTSHALRACTECIQGAAPARSSRAWRVTPSNCQIFRPSGACRCYVHAVDYTLQRMQSLRNSALDSEQRF
jgi:hypothetical protein